MKPCNGIINLQGLHSTEKRRGYQPPWYTVFIYTCESCGNKVTVRANSYIGKRTVPGHGAITCPHMVNE